MILSKIQKTFKNMLKRKYQDEEDFIEDLEEELTELDFSDTDTIRAAELIYREKE